jgi:adenine-specific DNA methylase
MVAVVTSKPGTEGKKYRIATPSDMRTFQEAEGYLKEKHEKLMSEWGMTPVPDEEIPLTMPGGIHTPTYGMKTWGSCSIVGKN